MQHLFAGFDFAEIDANQNEPVDYSELRAGMFVGYIFTGAGFTQSWRKGYVIGMDRDNPENTIAIVQHDDGDISTFHSECDSLTIWKG